MTDVASLLREAFYRYNSVDPLHPKTCVRLATRTMLTLADYCQQHGLYADAHAALMKAQGQVSFYAALLTYTLVGGQMGQLGAPLSFPNQHPFGGRDATGLSRASHSPCPTGIDFSFLCFQSSCSL